MKAVVEAVVEALRARKDLPADADLSLWRGRAFASLMGELGTRAARGALLRCRLGSASGLVLADRRVKIRHGAFITAGPGLNLEEGCEIIGLSRRGVSFGSKCTVGRYTIIRPSNVLLDEPGEGMRMGDNSNLGAYSWVGCSGFVDIGSNVMMGPRITLVAETHNTPDSDTPMQSQGVTRSFITIGDDCWIGSNVTILPGVTIGAGSIIGAGSVVTHDVPEYSVAMGIPARVARSRRPHDRARVPNPIVDVP